MPDRHRLDQKLEDAQKRWDDLSKKLRALREDSDLETRGEEKLRLKTRIAAAEAERQEVEAEIRGLEADRRVSTARRMERNGSFDKALEAWEEIRELDPERRGLDDEFRRLTEKDQLARRLKDASRRLVPRFSEIKDVYLPIAKELKQLAQTASELEARPDAPGARLMPFL